MVPSGNTAFDRPRREAKRLLKDLRGGDEAALRSIGQPALVVSIDSDVLYPPREQEELARLMPGSRLSTLHSPHGHDAFLIDMDGLSSMIAGFRRETGTL